MEKRRVQHTNRQRVMAAGQQDEVFLFLLFLPKRSVDSSRPGAVKGAPWLGAAERTLEGEDRDDRIRRGRKRPLAVESLLHGGQP